jgi:hypothetical protein
MFAVRKSDAFLGSFRDFPYDENYTTTTTAASTMLNISSLFATSAMINRTSFICQNTAC